MGAVLVSSSSSRGVQIERPASSWVQIEALERLNQWRKLPVSMLYANSGVGLDGSFH